MGSWTSKTFEDIRRQDTRNRLPSAASGTQQRQPCCGGRGQASGRWPWNPIPLRARWVRWRQLEPSQ